VDAEERKGKMNTPWGAARGEKAKVIGGKVARNKGKMEGRSSQVIQEEKDPYSPRDLPSSDVGREKKIPRKVIYGAKKKPETEKTRGEKEH